MGMNTPNVTVRQLQLVEMRAVGDNIAVTLSPTELQLRLKLPVSLSEEKRVAIHEAIAEFRTVYADEKPLVSLRGKARFVDGFVNINVKSGCGGIRMNFSHLIIS